MRALGSARPVAVSVVLLTLLAGCGSTAKPSQHSAGATPSLSAQATACRLKWAELGASLAGRDQAGYDSALAERWNSVLATIAYQAASATGRSCATALSAQRTAITQLETFGTRLRPFDMPYQLSTVSASVRKFLTASPPAASGTAKPPSKKQVRQALATLKTYAGASATDLQPGWQQANRVDLTVPAATHKAVKDLAFLASDSKPTRQCTAALAVLHKALAG
ncbi:MAG: hypothetical protein M3Z50_01080 [Actinomycetota bacterium]|nr:hypothetical protein [Actinomycetota bacterium]